MDVSDSPSDYDDGGEIPIWQEPRREPLGAPKETLCDEMQEQNSGDRLHALEEEQEILSSSVFSLTSHLAQVEFRLRQILKASPQERDAMLKELEEFTSRGVPGARAAPQGSSGEASCAECVELETKIRRQRTKQAHFIERLQTQLKELERFAANPEASDKQHRTLIEHLRSEIDRSLEEGCHQPLSADELRHQINCAVRQYADKQLSKEEIICKLQAHIEDMQKFIKLMKNEDLKNSKSKTPEPKSSKSQNSFDKTFNKNKANNDDLRTETINLMRKASTLIQIFTVSQFGCSPNSSRKVERQSSTIVTHWGNLRAKLEMSIDAVLHLVSRNRQNHNIMDTYDSESEEGGIVINDIPLTTAVRRHLAVNIRDLLQHGLTGPESNSLVPLIGCFPVRRSSSSATHVWDLILRYYDINDGDRFNSTPARKLSQSFNLDIVGGNAISNKQSLLSTIGSIIASHTPYKRSYDAHFKAFVCAALNSHKLVLWLNIILKCRSLVDSYYSSTSYVVNTGFQDALQSLDRLTPHNFDLPVDLAVKQFQNIKDVFM
ncbi:RUN domain-containing protein 1 [Cydia pomonella]|uniref:RUN domain-containing protein 1 n=1 Tax=Cydia pomonella TaxID=82600 RepID=UPI002ADE91D7|nr:RUN domain-containing protein 1 [Cydia pomonella]